MKLNTPIKKLLIIGDSYSTFAGCVPEGYEVYYTGEIGTDIKHAEQTWWHRFVTKTGTELVLNDSWSGSTVCYTGRPQHPQNGYISSFVHRMHLMIENDFFKKNDIDTVFIFGATNDSWLDDTPKGELILSDFTESDLYSTLPAIAYMISTLKEHIPCGNIVYIINTELDERIVNAVKVASEHFGTHYIELRDINKEAGHPTVLGMAQICDQIIEAIG